MAGRAVSYTHLDVYKRQGYISEKRIASANAVVFSYVLYLIVKYDYKLDASQLEKCISKWFFMRTITYFYTGSTESVVEKQFADLRDIHTADRQRYQQRGRDWQMRRWNR